MDDIIYAFFHKAIIHHQRWNRICTIQNEQGESLSSDLDIRKIFENFYLLFWGSVGDAHLVDISLFPLPTIAENVMPGLVAPFSLEEIRLTLFHLP